MKFRKKPVIIEAIQWTGKNYNEIRQFTGLKLGRDLKLFPGGSFSDPLIIPTLEGNHRAEINDWIIREVKDKYYVCKPDIFEMTYEPVEEMPKV